MKSPEINGEHYAVKIHQQKKALPSLLMLHGFMGDHRVFDHLIKDLASFCNPATVDLLGFGASSKPADSRRYGETHQVKDILKLAQRINLRPLFLFGYSMGGRLALKIALEAPDFLHGLILESATCGITNPDQRTGRQKIDAQRAKSIQKDFSQFLSRWKESDLFKSPVAVDPSLAEKYHRIQAEQSPEALAASLRGFGAGSMTPACDKLKELELPVLLLAGSADEKYQQINRYLAEQLPNATFSSIEAGHRMHLDNPTVFLSELENFIRNHS